MKLKVIAALCLASFCPAIHAPTVVAAPRTYEPKPGSAERKAIMDALRKPISKQLKKKVIFQVHHLKVCNGWAWTMVTALRPDGTRLTQDDLWGEAQGLLRKEGKTWRVLVAGIATDTSIMDEARKKYPKAPRSIYEAD